MKTVLLKELARVDISNVDKKIKDGEQKVVLCNFVDVYQNWQITASMVSSLMQATANKNQIDRFSIRKGQVAITKDSETRDDIGIATYIADDIENGVLGYHCALITPDENQLLGNYLNIVLHSPYAQKYFSANASGSGQRYTLTNEIIEAFPVPLPEIETQKYLGNLCSEIDDKISNNTAICSDLEAMAKLLYDYWFVQFDFPDENGKPYKSSGGKMVWNEELKREIPDGWEVKHTSDLTNVKTGKEDANFATENGKYAYFTCGQDVLKCDFPAFEGKAILLAGNGDFNVKHFSGKFNAYQRTYVLIPDDTKYYALMYIATKEAVARFTHSSAGSVVKFITLGDVNGIMILDPKNDGMLEKFNLILDKIEQLRLENQQLASLRDFLLPMLMNGQVKIK